MYDIIYRWEHNYSVVQQFLRLLQTHPGSGRFSLLFKIHEVLKSKLGLLIFVGIGTYFHLSRLEFESNEFILLGFMTLVTGYRQIL